MRKKIAKSLMVGFLALTIGLTSFGAATVALSKTAHAAKTAKAKVHKRTLSGKVTSISGTTVKMKKGKQSYKIEASGVTPVDKKGSDIAISDIKTGDSISVKGTVTGTKITKVTKLQDKTR